MTTSNETAPLLFGEEGAPALEGGWTWQGPGWRAYVGKYDVFPGPLWAAHYIVLGVYEDDPLLETYGHATRGEAIEAIEAEVQVLAAALRATL